MCERPKVHAFLGAPRPSASGARRVRPPRWRRLELTWQEGRLVPAADDDGATQEEERSHEESTGAWREQPLPRLQEDSRWPAGQPQAQLSLRSRYLSTWTLSQALFLRGIQWAGCAAEAPPQRSQTSAAPSAGTPQLLGPVARPPQGCERLWDARSSPGRAERGGVVLEATSDGVLCSQEAERHVSPPASKSARRCEAAADERVGAFTTLLAQCADAAARYRVLVVVVHPCHLKEIKVKRGAGSLVPLASVVVTDQSGVDTTVLLWRRAALWAAAIAAGDLVFITAESGHLQRRKDTAVHLQQQTAQHGSRQCPHLRHRGSPRGRRLALFSVPLPSRAPAIAAAHAAAPTSGSETPAVRPPVATQGQHAGPRPAARHTRIRQRSIRRYAKLHHHHHHLHQSRLVVTRCRPACVLRRAVTRLIPPCVAEWRAEAESWRRSALESHAVASVVGAGGQKGALLMWGSALDWLPRFRTQQDAVWDVRFLLVREGGHSDLPELHTTPWSEARRVDGADRRLGRFLNPMAADGVEMDVDTLLSQQYSGEAQVQVQVLSFGFLPSQDGPRPTLDGSSPLSAVLAELSGDVTYSGCGRCAAELDADGEGIYAPCYPCLPARAVRRYYRPAVLTVSGRSTGRVRVQVPAVAVQKIVDVAPDRLLRNAAAGCEVKAVQVAAERLHALPGKKVQMAVRSLFLCDENSAPISRELTLLDLRLLPDDG
ncbi:shieldin complex subunit 2 isoform X2 [Vanacampus margaritifer]